MRAARIKELGPAYYHVISRVVDQRMVFDPDEKERFRSLMRACETFCALRILTWTVLDNHFHLVLHVPPPQPVTDDVFLQRLAALYDRRTVTRVQRRLKGLLDAGERQQADRLKARYTYRMYDLSAFAKTFKQRLTQGFNRRHDRKGTLWEERYKSLVVEGKAESLLQLAAYVDLNAVRAGIVVDPKDYRFCGYAEAVAGLPRAREGLAWVLRAREPGVEWKQVAAAYRRFLYVRGEQRGLGADGRPRHRGFDPQSVAAVLAQGGELTAPELLRCRVRYFSDGAILGSRAYVEEACHRHRAQFGRTRRTGVHAMRGGARGAALYTARKLRREPITLPKRV